MKKIVPLILTLSVVFQLIAPCLVYADNAEARDVSAKKASLTEAADYNEYIKSLPENAASTDLSVSLLNGDKRTLADGKPLKTVFECKQSGLYSLKFNYAPLSENNASFNLKIDIDGAVPFFEASSVKLPCFYTVDNITVNADGDDVRPNVKLDKSYHSFTFSDKNTAAPYEIYLKEGAHSLYMSVDQGELNISDIVLFGYKAPPAYEEYKNKYPAVYEGDALPLTEAESFLYTNSNYVIASSDAGSAETTPSNPYNKKINTVGGSNWKSSGDVIAWETEAPEEGLYSISFRYKQNFQSGLNSYRTLYVNGEIPYKEAISIAFPYNNDWQVKEFEYKIHLNKGKNIIALEITADEIYDIITELNDAVTQELHKLIATEKINSVKFTDGTYEVTLPVSWVGTVTASFSENYVAFYVDKTDGGELTFFIIDNDTYGYSSDSYKGRIEVGRLISDEDVRFITARDNYSIASYAKSVSEEAAAIWNNYENDKLAIIESLHGVNGYEFYPEDGTALYYADAREMADEARSLWLSLNFAGEYPGSMKPVRFKRKNYVPMFPPYDYINTIESVRKKFLKVFSEEFTNKTLNRAIADKELIEYKGDVYVACKKRKGEASYNSCVDCVRDEGGGKFTVVIAVKMPPNGNKLYVDLPTEKNAAGEFVFSDYPYWEKSE